MNSRASTVEVTCPACGASRLKVFGTPRVIDWGIITSRPEAVCRCSCCDLLFFVPVQPANVLVDQYAVLAREVWTYASRPDWTLAREAILERMSAGIVLDVGCWTGGFLANLPAQFERWGVEPSAWARNQAVGRGVSFAGKSLDDLATTRATYDVVTMLDVIEHTTSPLKALALAAGRLKEGGVLIVTTGNSRALPWQLMPRDYWYYASEHVCFFSERWFRWAANQVDLEIEEVDRFSHYAAAWAGTPFAELARACAVRLLGGPRALPVRLARRAHVLRKDAETRHWPDHILMVFRKRPGHGVVDGG